MGKINDLIRPEVLALKAYAVPDAAEPIKLDAMENPYSWPESAKSRWLEALRNVALNRYPDSTAPALRARLRESLAVPDELDVMLGNGSDELIQIILLALAKPGAVAVSPAPSFSMYRQISIAAGMKFVGVALKKDFTLDMAGFKQVIARERPAVIFISNPNNPTGNVFAADDIEALIQEAPGLVVLDEAYFPFSGESFLARLGRYENVLILRTLSKQGLAGLRLGVLIGARAWLGEFDKVRLPYNINSLTQASVEYALGNPDVLEAQVQRICADREALYQLLRTIPGVTAWPSRTNFILFKLQDRSAGEIFAALRRAGILIKNLHGSDGLLDECLRVTVGTAEENAAFIKALKTACRNPGS